MNDRAFTPAVTEYFYQKAAASGIPLSGTFELTPLCNMNCKMCYVRLSAEEQQERGALATPEQWLSVAKQAKSAGMLYLLITGGEPFLYPGFPELMEQLHKMGLVITVNTNGTLIREDTVQWLKKCPPVRINISLYGASDETYGRLCGDRLGFTKVKEAICLLKEAGLRVKLNCSLTPENAADLPAMVDFAKEQDLYLQLATYMFPPVRRKPGSVEKNFRFTPEQAAYYKAYGDYLTFTKERFYALRQSLEELSENTECIRYNDGAVHCRAGSCSFWVTWQGQLLPCGMFPDKTAFNVFRRPLPICWEATKEMVAKIRMPEKCNNCPGKNTCRTCAAMVLAENGSFDEPPRYRCEMYWSLNEQYRKLEEEMK